MTDINRFRGLIIAAPTPFDRNREIAREAVGKMHGYFIANGVDGIFLLSSTGEYFAVPPRKREEYVDLSIAEVQGRVPLLMMVSDASVETVLENIRIYSRKKLDALVLTPPYYYSYSQRELERFYLTAADSSPLPLLIYNVPGRVPNNIGLELAQSLSGHPNIIGIKDTTTDADRLLRLLLQFRNRDDFLVYSGTERFAAYTAIFGGNFVYALAAVAPALFRQMLQSGQALDLETVMDLQERINLLMGLFGTVKGGYQESFSNFAHCIKGALALRGICETYNAQLGSEADEADLQRIANIMAEVTGGSGDGGFIAKE